MTSKVDELVQAVELGIEDAKGDFPDTNPDDIAWEIMNSVTAMQPPHIYNEVKARLGF